MLHCRARREPWPGVEKSKFDTNVTVKVKLNPGQNELLPTKARPATIRTHCEAKLVRVSAQIQPPIEQVTADGTYDGEPTYRTIAAHDDAITVVIPPQVNAVPSAGFETDPSPRDTHLDGVNHPATTTTICQSPRHDPRVRNPELQGHSCAALVTARMTTAL